jgi:hypothetical protein
MFTSIESGGEERVVFVRKIRFEKIWSGKI